jgi:hypothetical protein
MDQHEIGPLVTGVDADSRGSNPSVPPRSGAEVLSRSGSDDSLSSRSRSPLTPFFECWLDTFIFNGHVEPRLRELAILRLMWRCDQSFEWAHHYRLARHAGVSRQEILAIRTPDPARDLEGVVAVVVRAADDIVDQGFLAPETYAAIGQLFPEPEVLQEFLYLVAGYRMFASVSATTHVTAESSGLRMWPPDGVGPKDPTT